MLNGKIKKYLYFIFCNDKIILTLVIINALLSYIESNNTLYIRWIDDVLTVFFIIEVITKTSAYSFNQYFKDNWNKFDFIITILASLSLISLILPQVSLPLNFILSLRVLRVLKTFRLIKFIPNINSLLLGINRAIKTSIVVIIGFTILLFTASILTSTLFGSIAPEYFSSALNSTYTIFRLFSVEGWYEIPDTIANNSSALIGGLSKLYFSLLLFCGGILGLSLVNSIFVDAMMSDNNDEVLNKLNELEEKIDKLKKCNYGF